MLANEDRVQPHISRHDLPEKPFNSYATKVSRVGQRKTVVLSRNRGYPKCHTPPEDYPKKTRRNCSSQDGSSVKHDRRGRSR